MATDVLTVDTLIKKLDALWAMDAAIFPERENGYQVVLNIDQNSPLASEYPNESEIPYECCDVLITEGGKPDWDNIKILGDHGYEVYCTERDSFGWLGAAISKDDKVLYFG